MDKKLGPDDIRRIESEEPDIASMNPELVREDRVVETILNEDNPNQLEQDMEGDLRARVRSGELEARPVRDPKSGRVYTTFIDRKTGEVIGQLPKSPNAN